MKPTISPEALEIAQRQAETDRALLARLRASGAVLKQPGAEGRFVREIEAQAFPPRTRGLDTIRPKKTKKPKRR